LKKCYYNQKIFNLKIEMPLIREFRSG